MQKRLACPASLGKACKFLDVRRASKNDIKESVNLLKDAFPHMPIPERTWSRKLAADQTIAILMNGEQLVGMTNVMTKGDGASIDALAVSPGFQGKGIGTMLVNEAEDMARTRGKHVVTLMTEQSKPENIVFYSKHGYKVSGYDPNGYLHCPGVYFEKKI